MIKLLKTDDNHKTVSFCVLTPNIEDRNGDIISADEIIKTAHDFGANMNEKFLNIDHKDDTHIEKSEYVFVENFIAPADIIIGENIVKKGSWYVGIKFINEKLYEMVKSGDFVGVSMEGYFIQD
ncbi:hypothetical protein DLH72_02215 [Candidatus Gracilibacteria bacterium]|nr:MAG: hypothetical protein DLH72_02215 [Candidatus Gracilibacteria bacterium]